WSALGGLEKDASATGARLASVASQVAGLAAACAEARRETEAAQVESGEQQRAADRLGSDLAEAGRRLAELREEGDAQNALYMEQMRQAGGLHTDPLSYKAQLASLPRDPARLRQKSEQAAEHLASLDVELEELTSAEDALQAKLAAARDAQAALRGERDRLD